MENDIESRIREKLPTFSKGQRKIAAAIFENYEKTAYMTAARLGEMVDVSESTVVRFAIELGYEGYPELQRAIQESLRNRLTFNQRIRVTDERYGENDVLDSVLAAEVARIRTTLERIDRASFDATVDAIVRARHMYVIGVRSSASLASFLHFNLCMISDEVKLVQPTNSGEVFEQMLDIGEGDLLFAISFPRYSAKVINAVKFARAQGATVVALTDALTSPIAESAHHVLTAQSDMVSFVDSLVAPMSVLNAILVAVTKKLRARVTARFDKLERIFDEYGVYAKH